MGGNKHIGYQSYVKKKVQKQTTVACHLSFTHSCHILHTMLSVSVLLKIKHGNLSRGSVIMKVRLFYFEIGLI